MISWYWSRIRRPYDIAASRDRMISYTNARLTQTMQNGDNYLRDGHLKGPDIRPVGDRALPCLSTYALFDLYFAHLTNSSSSRGWWPWQRGVGASWVASTAMPCPRPHCVGQQKCADHRVWAVSVHGVWPHTVHRRASMDASCIIDLCSMVRVAPCCSTATDGNTIVPIDNNGKYQIFGICSVLHRRTVLYGIRQHAVCAVKHTPP